MERLDARTDRETRFERHQQYHRGSAIGSGPEPEAAAGLSEPANDNEPVDPLPATGTS